jgi:glycosyltransferase involved in cell wall biosynthesis
MKVLMISDTLEFSGAEEATLNLATLLSRQEDVEVQLCTTRFSDSNVQQLPFERSLRIDEQKPKRIEELYASLAHPRSLLRMVLHCQKVARDFRPDIIHSAIFLSVVPSLVIARRSKIPVVAHLHDYRILSLTDLPFLGGSVFVQSYMSELANYLQTEKPHLAFLGLGLRRSLLAFYNRCDHIIAVSNFTKNSLSKVLRPPVSVLYNAGYNFAQTEPRREKSDCLTVLYCGRLSVAKGFPIFLDAAEMLMQEIDVEIHIAGSGDLAILAHRFALNHGGKAFFHGFLWNEKFQDLVAQSHLTVHPSLSPEPCPLSVIKSVNFGTTAIASNRGGLPELLPSRYLFEPTPGEIRNKVLQFFERPQDYPPSLTPDLDGDVIAKQLLSVYRKVAKSRLQSSS